MNPLPAQPTQVELPAGTVLARRFRLVRLIGAGELGRVYEARDEELGVDVALRVLPRPLAEDRVYLEKLEREVACANRVAHPNICRVFNVQKAGGVTFVTMELARGRRLKDIFKERRLSPDRAARLFRQICMALEAAHRHGVVHGHLRSSQVMVDGGGRVKVLGLGLSCDGETDDASVGSARPPSGPITSADVYALGVLAYRLFSGQKLSRSPSRADLLLEVPPRFQSVVRYCLCVDPKRRFCDAAEVRSALDEIPGSMAQRLSTRTSRLVMSLASVSAGLALGWLLMAPGTSDALLPPAPLARAAVEARGATVPPSRASAPRLARKPPQQRAPARRVAFALTDIPVFE